MLNFHLVWIKENPQKSIVPLTMEGSEWTETDPTGAVSLLNGYFTVFLSNFQHRFKL